MKTRLAIVALCLATLNGILAQEASNSFALTQQGVVVDYAISAKKINKVELLAYARLTISNVKTNDNETTIIYNFDGLNKKKKPLGGNSSVEQTLTVTDGVILFESDPLMNPGNYRTSHEGFAFKIPSALSIGDKIESGVVKEKAKFPMSKEIENIVQYDDFYVTGEEDVSTNAGIFHCYKIEGMLNGSFQTEPLVMTNYAIWFSPKIGIVKIETEYFNETLVIDSVVGL